jgi:hypothetical protein
VSFVTVVPAAKPDLLRFPKTSGSRDHPPCCINS